MKNSWKSLRERGLIVLIFHRFVIRLFSENMSTKLLQQNVKTAHWVSVISMIQETNGQEVGFIGKEFDCSKADYDTFFTCSILGEGFYQYPNPTIFFECVKTNGAWASLCYTCNAKFETIFLNKYGGCTTFEAASPNVNDSLTYSCDGYNEQYSFPCKYYEGQTKVHPGDKSVYWECVPNPKHDYIGICHVCPKENKSCYVESVKRCVKDCGTLEKPKPYNCSGAFYECSEQGFFPHPKEPTIFFQCIKKYTTNSYVTLCFTCSSTANTCFNEGKRGCIKKRKGSSACQGDPVQESRTYDCSGYKYPFPCEQKGEGTWGHRGDKSVYFICKKSGDKYEVTCKTCSKSTLACFDERKRKCIDNCVRPPPPPDSPSYPPPPPPPFPSLPPTLPPSPGGSGISSPGACRLYSLDPNYVFYDCLKTGIFPDMYRDHTKLYQCISKASGKRKFASLCFECPFDWCYSEWLELCVDGCVSGGIPLTHSCKRYGEGWQAFFKVPCGHPDYYPDVKYKPHIGDPSVYFECDGYHHLCYACSKSQNACFDPQKQKCIPESCKKNKG